MHCYFTVTFNALLLLLLHCYFTVTFTALLLYCYFYCTVTLLLLLLHCYFTVTFTALLLYLMVARCTCFNTYIVSVMPYTASYLGLCTTDLNLLRQQAVKFLLKRHWLESEILPYVLRFVGLAPVLDPALVATVAATGLYFREGNTLEDLINMNLLPDGCNLRQRSVVHDLLQFGLPLSNFRKFMQLSPIEVGDSKEGLADLKVPSTRAWLWLPKQGLGRKSSKRAGAEASPRSGSRSPLP